MFIEQQQHFGDLLLYVTPINRFGVHKYTRIYLPLNIINQVQTGSWYKFPTRHLFTIKIPHILTGLRFPTVLAAARQNRITKI
jgi:hypothetical protein